MSAVSGADEVLSTHGDFVPIDSLPPLTWRSSRKTLYETVRGARSREREVKPVEPVCLELVLLLLILSHRGSEVSRLHFVSKSHDKVSLWLFLFSLALAFYLL